MAVPRDVDPEIAAIPSVSLVDVDGLRSVVDERLNARRQAVPAVERLIAEYAERFESWYRTRATVPVIARLTQKAEAMRAREVERLFARCPELNERQRTLIVGTSMTIVSKLLHSAILKLRDKAGVDRAGLFRMPARSTSSSISTSPASSPTQWRAFCPMHPSGDRPLRGKRVLITRAGEQSDSFASALRMQGAQPLVAPTIAICALSDLSALDDAIQHLSHFSWLVFTSQNGVDVFMPRLARYNATTAGVKIAAIGQQTANRLRKHGASVTLTAEQHVSEALAAELIAVATPGERMLLVRAFEGREVLARRLEESGAKVTTVPAYRTAIAQDPAFAAKVGGVDAVTFTSASTVRGFDALLQGRAAEASRGKCIACIGPVTAEAASRLGLHVNAIAVHHTVGGLIDALRTHYGVTA